MSQILFKIGVFSALLTFLLSIFATMPDAGPLPEGVQVAIEWLLPMLYFIDPIFPMDTFFEVLAFAISGYLVFLSLVGIKKIIKNTIASAS